jgi:HSP20 family protein
MRLIRYYPNTTRFAPALGFGRSPWAGLETEIDRLFETTLSGLGGTWASGSQFPVDLYEDKNNTYVRAELPGVSRGDVSVEIVEGNLTIAASRKDTRGEDESAVAVSRSISVPEDVRADQVSASFENGVLTVTLPKREEAKPKKVAVTVT